MHSNNGLPRPPVATEEGPHLVDIVSLSQATYARKTHSENRLMSSELFSVVDVE